VLPSHILIVDDDESLLRLLTHWLEKQGYKVSVATRAGTCLSLLEHTLPDVILLDLNLPDQSDLETLQAIRKRCPQVPVLMSTTEGEVETVVRAMQLGAWDYLQKPLQRTKLLTTLGNAVDRSKTTLKLAELSRLAEGGHPKIIGQSPAMMRLFAQMDRVGPSEITVLLRGESGTGKELVAQALHECSRRSAAPFVAVNCGAIPENLQESELFGHEKGAFTGASTQRKGRFEQAEGGTLFLDEVAELGPSLQASLLRVLQERTYFRVGGSQQQRADLRILAATHRDLREMVIQGTFREDLYYRLAVFELRLPPLREREGDLLLLTQNILEEMSIRHSRDPVTLSPEAAHILATHPWPGNVRELRNALERATVLAEVGVIDIQDLPPALNIAVVARQQDTDHTARLDTRIEAPAALSVAEPTTLDEIQRQTILDAMESSDGNLSEVCRRLNIPRSTLYRRLRTYGIR
jgi:DNA-binding NtrC family response regulator